MNPITIVSIIRVLVADGQSDEQIAQTIEAMGGFGNSPSEPIASPESNDQPAINAPAPATGNRRGGLAPSVKYHTLPGITSKRIASLPPRLAQVGALIAKHNRDGITKRAVMDALKITKGAAMSAIHGLQTAGIVRSVPIEPITPAKPKRTVPPARVR